MVKKLQVIFSKADVVISRYPMVLVMAVIATICAVILTNKPYYGSEFEISKLMILAFLGISLFFALKMASQRFGKWLLLELIGVLLLTVLYFVLPKNEKDFTEPYFYLLTLIAVILHLLVSFVAFLKIDQEKNFWNYNKNLFLNLFSTIIFTGVLIGGVELAILAVENLFDLDFGNKIYTNVFLGLSIFGSVFIFLLFSDRGLKILERENNYPVILKFFTQFILIPLLLIYVVILYFYAGKILINWELPRGWVSYLILAYSITGIFALLLVHPLKEESSRSWVKLFSKIFYLTLVPLLVLLFLAIFTRILEYGYTEPRYFVLMIAIWLTVVVFYFITIKRSTIKFIPLSLFCFGLFSIAFPFLNAFSMAKYSQKKQIDQLLKRNALVTNGKINFNKKISIDLSKEIADKVAFLAIRNEREYLTNLINGKDISNLKTLLNNKNEYEIQNRVRAGFKNIPAVKIQPKASFLINNAEAFVHISNYDYALDWQLLRNGVNIKNDTFKLETDPVKPEFYLLLNNDQKLDFTRFMLETVSRANFSEFDSTLKNMETTGKLGKYDVKIIIKTINVETDDDLKRRIYIQDAEVLLKLTD